MKATELALLVLGVLPGLSGADHARAEAVASVAPKSPVTSPYCAELRETEAALAEHEVHLLDQLALPGALAWEKDGWKKELEYAQDSLDEVDAKLKDHGCPTL